MQDTLWIAEQMPGLVASSDVTSYLELGYWPSYNVPMQKQIQEYSGLLDNLEKHPEAYVYLLNNKHQQLFFFTTSTRIVL